MVDFGNNHPDKRPLRTLLNEKLRPGDIYTHMYSGLRDELLNGQPNPGLAEGRKRGVYFAAGLTPIAVRAWQKEYPLCRAPNPPYADHLHDLRVASAGAVWLPG